MSAHVELQMNQPERAHFPFLSEGICELICTHKNPHFIQWEIHFLVVGCVGFLAHALPCESYLKMKLVLIALLDTIYSQTAYKAIEYALVSPLFP